MSNKASGAPVRAAAAEVIDAVVSSGRSLDDALLAAQARLPDSEHALLSMLCFGSLRSWWHLQGWIASLLDRPMKKQDSVINALLAVGLLQLTDTRIPDHAAVSATVEAARLLRRPRHAGLLNAVLRRFMRENLQASEPRGDEARFDHPAWIIDRLQKDWPDDWQSILSANNERAPMWLRATTSDYCARLAEADIAASPRPGWPATIRLEQPVPVADLPGFTEGEVSVQDAAAQIAAPWLLADLEGRILDACAAPGGKSAHLKELGGATIDLTCIDKDPERTDSIRQNLARLGLDATISTADASTTSEWFDDKQFNGILLDAPCSASGVIRRHPDIKHLRRSSDIESLAKLQRALLDALWPLLAPGGRLLYVTCSVFSSENDAVVAAFLDATNDAMEKHMLQNNNIRDVMRQKAYGYQVLPGTDGLDGFYFACLEKVV